MNLVSFSLYGDNPKYLVGAVQNAHDVPKKYPGFEPVFFVDSDTVPRSVIRELRNAGAWVHAGNKRWMPNPKLWRLTATMFSNVGTVLFRDADSRITSREVAAVTEWLKSPFAAHVMRDFPKHTAPIMAGMWGLRSDRFPRDFIGRLWNGYMGLDPDWNAPSDQVFLRKAVWPVIRDNVMEHDEFTGAPGARMFPKPFDPAEGFVGEVILETGQGIPEHKAFRGIAPYGPK
jgi:hypothetical protein